MKLMYIGDHDEVVVPLLLGGEIKAKKNQLVNFPDSLAKSLLIQTKNWKKKGAK